MRHFIHLFIKRDIIERKLLQINLQVHIRM